MSAFICYNFNLSNKAYTSDLAGMDKVDRSNNVAWIGDINRNAFFTCSKNDKTLTVTFTDGSTVKFTGS